MEKNIIYVDWKIKRSSKKYVKTIEEALIRLNWYVCTAEE